MIIPLISDNNHNAADDDDDDDKLSTVSSYVAWKEMEDTRGHGWQTGLATVVYMRVVHS
jgi:hypothetical protein